MTEILDRPPDDEGDDQQAKDGAEDTERVTLVDLLSTDELDDEDVEDEPDS